MLPKIFHQPRSGFTVIPILLIACPAMAELIDRGGGLIYDTQLNITLLRDANYAQTSGFDDDGRMTWPRAMSWVAGLSYFDPVRNRTWDDWRLPSALHQAGKEPCFAFNCTESEMGHLFHSDLIQRNTPGPFLNFQPASYWSSTGRVPLPGTAWLFHFGIGKQDFTGPMEQLLTAYPWPVRDGDVAGIIPTATSDSAPVVEGTRVRINLAENDVDTDDGLDLGSINIISGPSHGSISGIAADGSIDYTHNGSETLADSFTYTIDDFGGTTSNVASVGIAVTPRNDAPLANDDRGTAIENRTATINLAANDTDADDPLDLTSIRIIDLPLNGNVIVKTDGSVDYLSSQAGATTDTFSYTISDQAGASSNTATVAISISPADSNSDGISDAAAILLGLDPDDPDGDTDNDMIPDTIEVGGNIRVPLDSDQDGMIDALEAGATAADATVASGLSVGNGEHLSINTSAAGILSDVTTGDASGGPAGINFSFGTVSYTTTAPLGGSVAVQLAFFNTLPANIILFKVDHAGIFTELPHSTWTRVDARTVEVILTDGDPATDLDGVVNGLIEDPIAIGVAPASTPAPSTPVPATSSGGGGGGCTLNAAATRDPGLPFMLMIATLGLLWNNRRSICS